MTIKSEYETADEIPAQYRELYEQRGNKWELAAIEGVKPESAFADVKKALEAERERARQIEAQWKSWTPLAKHDPQHIQSVLDRLPEYEAMAKQTSDIQARIDEVSSARIKAATLPIERERDALRAKYEEAETTLKRFAEADRQRKIVDAIRAAAGKTGLDPDSLEDAVLFGQATLEVAADGVVQVRDGAPGIPAGIDVERMLAHVRDNGMRPRWWSENVSGGLRGGRASSSSIANPWAKGTINVTEQARLEQTNPAMAKKLKEAARA